MRLKKYKLKNQGFTLAEVLAVIVIIVVIFMIASYTVVNILKTSKESSLQQTYNELKKTASVISKELNDDNWGSIGSDKLNNLGINHSAADDLLMACVSVQDMINGGYYKENEFDDVSGIDKDTYVIVVKNNKSKVVVTEEIDKNGYCKNWNPSKGESSKEDILIDFDSECTNKEKEVEISYPNSSTNNMFMIDGSEASVEEYDIYECNERDADTCSSKATSIASGRWYKVEGVNIKIKVKNNSIINTYSYDDANTYNKEASIDTIDTLAPKVPTIITSDGINTGDWHDNIYSLNAYNAKNEDDGTGCAAVTYTYRINDGEEQEFEKYVNGVASLGIDKYGKFKYTIIAKNEAGNTSEATYDSRLSKYTIILDNQGANSAGTNALYGRYSDGIYLNDKYVDKLGKISIPQKTGYNFKGYYTSKNGTGTKKIDANGNGVNFSSEDYKKDVTLYANWMANTYTITLDNQNATTRGTSAIYEKYGVGIYKDSSADGEKMTTSANPIDVPTLTGYTFKGYYTEKNGKGTQMINANGNITGNFTNNKFSSNTILYAYWKDETTPTCTLGGGTTLKATSQSLSATITEDGSGVSKYYWGTSSTGTPETALSTKTLSGLTANSAATYYLRVQDNAGNVGSCSVVIRSYVVNNLLETVDGTTDTYTSVNYTSANNSTYYIKDGTTITLTSVYEIPTGATANTFKGYSTSYSTTAVIPSTTNPKISTNTTYYMWFNRETYTVTVKAGIGGTNKVVSTQNKTGVIAASGNSTIFTVKYGDTITATATATSGYKFTGFSGLSTSKTSPATATITAAGTITASFAISTYTVEYYLGNNSNTDGATKLGSSTCNIDLSCVLKTWSSLGGTVPNSSYGWSFAGWSSVGGTNDITISYNDGASVDSLSSTGNVTVRLYAIMERQITFYSGINSQRKTQVPQYWNPYSTSANNRSVTNLLDESDNDLLNTASISSWTFSGYKLNNKNADVIALKDAETPSLRLKVDVDPTLYALYTRDISIVYNSNGGSGTMSNLTETQYYNSFGNISEITFTLSECSYTKTNYDFILWGTSSTATTGLVPGKTDKFSPSVSSTVVKKEFYAIWSQNPHISFTLGQSTYNTVSVAETIEEWNSFEIYNDISIACSKDKDGKIGCKEVKSSCTGVNACEAKDGTQALGWLNVSDRAALSWDFTNYVSGSSGIDMQYNDGYDYDSFNSLDHDLEAGTGNEYDGSYELNTGGLRWLQFVATKGNNTIRINVYLALMFPPEIQIGKSTNNEVNYYSHIDYYNNVACSAGICHDILKDKYYNLSGNSEFSSSCSSISACAILPNSGHKIYYNVKNGEITEIAYNEVGNYKSFPTSFSGNITSGSPITVSSGGYRLLRFTAEGDGGRTVGYVYLAVGSSSDFSTSSSSLMSTMNVRNYYTLSGNQATSSWLSLDDDSYYLDNEGKFVSNTTTGIGDSNYIFDNNGNIVDGWYTKGGYYYYMVNGDNLRGTVTSDGDTAYYINDSDTNESKWLSFDTDGRQIYAVLDKDISAVYLEPNSNKTEVHKISSGTKLTIMQTSGTVVSNYGSNYERLGLMTDDGYEFYYDINKSSFDISCKLKTTSGDEIVDCP